MRCQRTIDRGDATTSSNSARSKVYSVSALGLASEGANLTHYPRESWWFIVGLSVLLTGSIIAILAE
jgi:hypothetical protein